MDFVFELSGSRRQFLLAFGDAVTIHAVLGLAAESALDCEKAIHLLDVSFDPFFFVTKTFAPIFAFEKREQEAQILERDGLVLSCLSKSIAAQLLRNRLQCFTGQFLLRLLVRTT